MPDHRPWWDGLTPGQRALVISGAIAALCAGITTIVLLSRRSEGRVMQGIRADLPDLLAEAEELGRKLRANGT